MRKAAHIPGDPNALKAVSMTDDEIRVANHIILFGDAEHRDMQKEYFMPDVDAESPYTKAGRLPVGWEHGFYGHKGEPGRLEGLGYVDWSTAKKTEKGIFVERVLDRRNKYIKLLEEAGIFEDGLLCTSSEAMPEGVMKARDGGIKRWPLSADTLTVAPMEPQMLKSNQLQAFKAAGFFQEEDVPEAAVDGARKAMSMHQRMHAVSMAFREQHPMPEGAYADVADVFDMDGYVVANVYTGDSDKFYQVNFEEAPGGYDFAARDEWTEVEAQRMWVAKKAARIEAMRSQLDALKADRPETGNAQPVEQPAGEDLVATYASVYAEGFLDGVQSLTQTQAEA